MQTAAAVSTVSFDAASARALRALVDSSGYRSFHSVFGDGNRSYQKWLAYVDRLEDPLRGMVELFLLQRAVEPERARQIAGDTLIETLVAAGVLCETAAGIRTANLILISFRSILFFHEHVPRPSVYFGNDSIGMGVYQHPAHGGTTLDLCAGTGIQAMIAAQHARHSYAVEINERAADIACMNVLLNGLDRRITVINEPLEEFAGHVPEPFDLITFNPPLLPVPEALDYPFIGDGGPDGLDVTRRILALYLPHVTSRGVIEFIGCGLGRDGHATFVDDLGHLIAAHGARAHVTLIARSNLLRGDVFHDALVDTAAMNSLISSDFSHEVYNLHYARLGMNELYTFFMRIENGARKAGPTVTVANVSEIGNCWFSREVLAGP